EDYDPHPSVYDAVLETLRDLGQPGILTGPRLVHFELVLLRELGYAPALNRCADCAGVLPDGNVSFSGGGGGGLCGRCQGKHRDRYPRSAEARRALGRLSEPGTAWQEVTHGPTRAEVRQVLNYYIAFLMGRRPRLQPYLGS